MASAFEQQDLAVGHHEDLAVSHHKAGQCGKRADEKRTRVLVFEQQPRESDKAFAAFRAYLGMGPERTLARVAKEARVHRNSVWKWSKWFDWRGRVKAHGEHLAKVERETAEAVVRAKGVDWAAMHEWVRRQAWAEAEDLIALAQDFKKRWRDSDRLPDFGALLRALDLAFKLKQFAAGMPSEIKEVNTTVTGKLDVEWEMAFKRVYQAKTGPEQVEKAEPAAAVVDVEVLADGHQVRSVDEVRSVECGVRSGEQEKEAQSPESKAQSPEGKAEGERLLASAATGEGGAA